MSRIPTIEIVPIKYFIILMFKKSKRSIKEVHDRPDHGKANDIREELLEDAQSCADNVQEPCCHETCHIGEAETESRLKGRG